MKERTNEGVRRARAVEGSRRAAENREPKPKLASKYKQTRSKRNKLPMITRADLPPGSDYICPDRLKEDIRG